MRKANTFFYLRIRNSSSNANGLQDVGCGSVYDLELTTQDEIDKLNYFTLSKEGIIIILSLFTSEFLSLLLLLL